MIVQEVFSGACSLLLQMDGCVCFCQRRGPVYIIWFLFDCVAGSFHTKPAVVLVRVVVALVVVVAVVVLNVFLQTKGPRIHHLVIVFCFDGSLHINPAVVPVLVVVVVVAVVVVAAVVAVIVSVVVLVVARTRS